jgi:hypothetical protein
MGQGLGDLVALARCGRLAVGLPGAVTFGCRMLSALTGAYEDVVAPVVERTINDLDERAQVSCALRAMSAKIGVAMVSYARLAGCEQGLEIAALAGAVTRLYDDLIDGSTDASLDERLADLFNARLFNAHGDLERLLAELVNEIRQRVRPLPGDTVDVALNALHEYQCLSRRQRGEAVPLAVLEKICRGKGAMANLTLCSLVKPRMDVAERELVMALGETFQSLDDYMDVEQDKNNGVATLASLGATTLTDIGLRMCVLRSRLVARYGRTAARPYSGMIYFLLLKSAVGRRLPVIGRITSRLAGRSAALAFLARGPEAAPAART